MGEKCRANFRPYVTKTKILDLAQEVFGLVVKDRSVKELESYGDRNFYLRGNLRHAACANRVDNDKLRCEEHGEYVLKVLQPKNTYASGYVHASIKILEHLIDTVGSAGKFRFPENIRGLDGNILHLKEFDVPLDYLAENDEGLYQTVLEKKSTGDDVWKLVTDEDENLIIRIKLFVRLLSFLPGKPMVCFQVTDDMFRQLGVLAGTISESLKSITHPSLKRDDIWEMKNLRNINTAKYLDCTSDEKKMLLKTAFDLFEKHVLPVVHELPHQSLHADINEGNVIVEERDGKHFITGLIDFGDVAYSCRFFEIGIGMAYMSLLRPDDCIKVAGIILSAYLSVSSLSDLEYNLLYYCVVGRIAQSLAIGNYSFSLNPSNVFLLNTSKTGFRVLEKFLSYKDNVKGIYEIWSNER